MYKGLNTEALQGLKNRIVSYNDEEILYILQDLYDVYKTTEDRDIAEELGEAYKAIKEGIDAMEYVRVYLKKVDIVK